MKRASCLVVTVAALALVLGAYQGKVAQCNKLTKEINTQGTIFKAEQAKLKFDTKDVKKTGKQLEHIADIFRKAADKVEGISLKDSKLKDFRKQWVAMVKDIANKFIDAKKALAKMDVKAALKAQGEIVKAGQKESKIINGINSYCSAQ